MKTKIKTLWPFGVLLVLSCLLHFSFLGSPNKIVFDEVHFANYAKYYLSGDYYFDIHPPLGKLMIAGFLELAGDDSFFDVRFLPALFGSLFILVVSWFAFVLTRSKNTALIAGFLVLADNALLVQSRFALLDIFLLFFSVLALCFFFLFLGQKTYGRKWFAYLSLSAIFCSLAVSIKWTGLATAGIMVIFLVAKNFNNKRKIREVAASLAIASILGVVVYSLPFAIHFNILTNFERQNFPMEQFSYGKEDIKNSSGFFQKLETINTQMLTANLGSTAKNPDNSPWFNWPFNQKPLHYSTNVYFKGNTALWLLVVATVLATLAKIIFKKKLPFDKTQDKPGEKGIFIFLLFGYFANLLPFIFIQRTTFVYHYLPALIFGIILLAYWLNTFRKSAKPAFAIILVIIGLNFLIFLPHSLGLTF